MNNAVYLMVLEAAKKLKTMPREEFICLLEKSNFPFEYEHSTSSVCKHEFIFKQEEIKKEYLVSASKWADVLIKRNNKKNSLNKIFYDINFSNCKLKDYSKPNNVNVDIDEIYRFFGVYYKKIEIKGNVQSSHTKELCLDSIETETHSEWSEYNDGNHMALVVNF
ncbi:hypothetical protein AB7X05_04535 [Providencia rettgeri]